MTSLLKGWVMGQVRPWLESFFLPRSFEGSNLSLETGSLALRNLELNPNLLTNLGMLDLPVELVGGLVRELRVQFSWTRLLDAPVHVEIGECGWRFAFRATGSRTPQMAFTYLLLCVARLRRGKCKRQTLPDGPRSSRRFSRRSQRASRRPALLQGLNRRYRSD
jgi:hypothetical protein